MGTWLRGVGGGTCRATRVPPFRVQTEECFVRLVEKIAVYGVFVAIPLALIIVSVIFWWQLRKVRK